MQGLAQHVIEVQAPTVGSSTCLCNPALAHSSCNLQVLVQYIDEVQACILDARSAAASLCKPVPRAEKVGRTAGSWGGAVQASQLAAGVCMPQLKARHRWLGHVWSPPAGMRSHKLKL